MEVGNRAFGMYISNNSLWVCEGGRRGDERNGMEVREEKSDLQIYLVSLDSISFEG